MNSEGFGSNGAPFTYTIEKQGKSMTKRKVLLILAYVAWVIVVFVIGVWVKLILPLLCFIPVSVWIISWLTWKFTHEEYNITLFSGTMTVARTYDGKMPKTFAEVKVKDLDCFEKYSTERIEKYGAKNIIDATSNGNYNEAYIAVWGETAVVMEANEKAIKIIKYYNNSLFEIC